LIIVGTAMRDTENSISLIGVITVRQSTYLATFFSKRKIRIQREGDMIGGEFVGSGILEQPSQS
jgi:hypothetical protein